MRENSRLAPKELGAGEISAVCYQLLSNPPSWHEASRRCAPAREPIFLETLSGMSTFVFTESVNEGAGVEKR